MTTYYLPEDLDWTRPVAGGPLDRGFDYYFGDGTINFPPYAWMENDRLLQIPTETMDIHNVGYTTKEGSWEFRPGPKVTGWNPYDVLPTLTAKTMEWIAQQSEKQAFFLYVALPSPHAPIIPNDEFDGRSQAGAYGDFMVQTDWVAGQVLQALKANGLEDNTLVIFSSDNGPEAYAWKRAESYGHFSMGDFRGLKRDVWEGGHHVPFIIKWPGQIRAGTSSDEVVSQIDVMATLASIAGIELPENAAPDSYDLLPVLLGKEYDSPLREALIHNTNESIWGIRKGDWLFINHRTGGLRELPESFKQLTGYTDFHTPGLLFNMQEDPEQRVNLYEKFPEKVKDLEQMLHDYRHSKTVFQFDTSRWRIQVGKDYPFRDQMLHDLVYNDTVRMLNEQEIIDLLGMPDRRTDDHFYYTVTQKRIGSWPLHTKSMVIKFSNNRTIDWIKIHE
jgi:arylsulfatase A-like enzyme